jgi:hypothetical protein
MLGAFAYLQATSLFNALRQRVLRLRQPKYLFGFLAGAGYLYFFLFRHLFRDGGLARGRVLDALPAGMAGQLVALAAAALLVIVVLAWLWPGDRAALRFSEAEVAFLFPAPLSRLALINFSLLRSQMAIFFTAFIMSLLLRSGGSFGIGAWQHAAAIWLLLATLRLHFLGASFTRERLLDLGLRPLLRRLAVVGLVALVALASWWWLRAHVPAPDRDQLAEPNGLLRYAGQVLAAPPLGWLLAPFKLLVAPLFAHGAAAFWQAAWPAALLLVGHYLWVLRSQVSFEEASIDLARRRAERSSAFRSGKQPFLRAPSKPRAAPFRLAGTGLAPIAFLWKGLIAAGPLWRLRPWLLCALEIVVGCRWLGADPAWRPALQVAGAIAGMFCLWLFLMGPMFVQRGLRQTLDHLDILKASPLHGWQIALGELLSPTAIISFVQWLLLLLAVLSFQPEAGATLWTFGHVLSAALGVALLAPPLSALMLCVPFAGLLYFPAWAASAGSRGGGFEVMGQRMIFMAGYLLTLVIALLPAVVIAGIAFLLLNWLASMSLALLASALVAGLVLAIELAAVLWWLGRRIDDFDLSQELR